jgi:Immune inhibitor A peptidase M6.
MHHARTKSVWGILILVVLMICAWGAQAAAAGPSAAGSVGAKLVEGKSASNARVNVGTVAPAVITLPAKALDTAPAPQVGGPRTAGGAIVTLLSDGFEGAFAWQAGYGSDAAWSTTWGVTNNRSSAGAYSAYCAEVNNPLGVYDYPDSMDGTMNRGPFDLTNSTAATWGFDTYLASELNFDYLGIYYSVDGVTFYPIQSWSGYTGGWAHVTCDLSALCGQPHVWLMFRFTSDSTNNAEGAYVDQVSLTKFVPDTTAPTTTANADALWHNAPVTVALTASDNAGGSGVASTMWSLDNGVWTAGTQVPVNTSGIHTINFYSVDAAGNTEATKSCTVKIDMTRPTPKAYASRMRRGTTGKLRFSISDIPRAKANVTITVKTLRGRKLATKHYSNVATNTMLAARFHTRTRGTYRFYVSARDAAGNLGTRTAHAKLVVK